MLILSALMAGDHPIDAWLGTVAASDLHTTTVTRAEIRYGIAARADALFEEIRDRTLAFSPRAADAYGEIVAARENAGRPIGVLDAQIAAIARAHLAGVATRNVADFTGCGIPVVNPYARAAP